MRALVTGVGGQLGHDVMNELNRRGHEGIGSDLAPVYSGIQDKTAVTTMPYVSLDITDRDAVFSAIRESRPDVVVHCAAWTAVDLAEDDDKKGKVSLINVQGTRNIADACKEAGCAMVYISTDYVFDGQGTEPWKPECTDYHPLNYYGWTKLEGEKAVSDVLEKFFIVRTAWVFGLNGNNFIKTMLQVGKKYDTVRVVNDQVGTPTYTIDLARLLVDMIETEKYGYYHATNEGGYISWYEFACEIFRRAGYATKVVPVTTQEYGLSKAARPFNSRLDKSKLTECGFTPLPVWQDALDRYLKKLLDLGYFPQGHFDRNQTTFILTDEVFSHYLELEKSGSNNIIDTTARSEDEQEFSQLSPEESAELSRMIREGNDQISRIRSLNNDIPGVEISAKLDRLEGLLKEIFARIREHPDQMSRIHELMDYYLPTVVKLVDAYREYDRVSEPGKEILEAKTDIENTLDTINSALSKLLNKLFKDSVLDVTTDAQVLKTVLTQKGLTNGLEDMKGESDE